MKATLITAAQRQFTRRMLNRAFRNAQRRGKPEETQQEFWLLMTRVSWRGKQRLVK